jgi:hypothetical protein
MLDDKATERTGPIGNDDHLALPPGASQPLPIGHRAQASFLFVVHAPCAPDVRELNTFGPARLEPDLKEGLVVAGHLDGDPGALSVTSAEELRRRGNRASHIPSTAQGADLIAGQIIRDNSRTAQARANIRQRSRQ